MPDIYWWLWDRPFLYYPVIVFFSFAVAHIAVWLAVFVRLSVQQYRVLRQAERDEDEERRVLREHRQWLDDRDAAEARLRELVSDGWQHPRVPVVGRHPTDRRAG